MRNPRSRRQCYACPGGTSASFAIIACGAISLVACSADPALEPVAVQSAAVIGGEPAAPCEWPSTVRVNGCTGTLIHHRVVITAAHCLSGDSATISFGPRNAGGFSLQGTCRAGARGERGVNTRADWGYCMLPEDERVEGIAITPPLVGCEAERFLQPGARAWVVGYGETRGTGTGVSGSKNQVEVTINELDKMGPGTIDVGDANVGACHGDSGGPIYLQLEDGDKDYGFRVFGSTSGPGRSFCDCNCSTTYVNVQNHIDAIEENEDVDVTPCTDAEGNWDPGPECDQMLADPQHGTGTWPNCEVALTTTPIATCGPAFMPDAGVPPVPDAGTSGAGGSGAGTSGAGAGAGGMTAGAPAAGIGGAPAPIAGATATGGAPAIAGSAAPLAGSPAPGFGAPSAGAFAGQPAWGGAPAPAAPAPTSGGLESGCSAAGARRSSRAPLLGLMLAASLLLAARRRSDRRGCGVAPP